MMNDYISAAERVYNPLHKWISQDMKDSIILLTLGIIFIFLLTQPN
jgi:hypothetical protein